MLETDENKNYSNSSKLSRINDTMKAIQKEP